MTSSITMPVTRAVDRAVRLLQLTYRMATLHRGTTVAEALEHVAGYADEGLATATEYGSATRKFEHDKKALRGVGIPIGVRRYEEPKGTYYKIAPRDLFLPVPAADRHGWDGLHDVRAPLQRVADSLPRLPVERAAPLTTVLLAYREAIGLTLPSWEIPRVMLTNGPLLLDWFHSTLHMAVARGRGEREWGGAPVAVYDLCEATGLPHALLQHVADRADAARAGRADLQQAVRIMPVVAPRFTDRIAPGRGNGSAHGSARGRAHGSATGSATGSANGSAAGSATGSANGSATDSGHPAISVVAPDMRTTWRPPLGCVHTMLQVAREMAVPLPEGVADTLCRHARPGGLARRHGQGAATADHAGLSR